jgi:hypothetical protein
VMSMSSLQSPLEADPMILIVVGYEPARYASISTTTRATLMLSIIHGTATVRFCSVMLLWTPPRFG